MRRKVAIEEAGPEVNLTPLIDVVFVVLIMFILIAPVLEIGKVELADAGSHNKDATILEKEDSPVIIHVEKDDAIFINKIRVKVQDLPRVLNLAKAKHPKAKPLVFHDKRATFGIYNQVKNALEGAGFVEMDLVLNPVK